MTRLVCWLGQSPWQPPARRHEAGQRSGPLGSGPAGPGLTMSFERRFYLRQTSYDSISVTGLDIFSGLLRAGMTC